MAVIAGITGAAVAPWRPSPVKAVSSGSAQLHVFGGRTAAQAASPYSAKYDAALASIARHLPQVQSSRAALTDLRSLNPGMRFSQPAGANEPLVLIDAVTTGDPRALKATLEGLGLQHSSMYSNDVGGWLPLSQLETATRQASLHSIRAAMPKTRSGAVTTQGDYVIHADTVRSTNSLNGGGITVGIISDSYNCYAQYAMAGSGVPASGPAGYASNGYNATASTDVGTGDLPASSNINIIEEASCLNFDKTLQLPMGDEGRAMMQIVHDVAPGAKLAFYTAENSEADFAAGIQALANAGAQVIADDVGYFDEPVFQDGIVAQAINAVAANGVAYFSAAGNNGNTAYDDTAPDFTALSSSAPNSGEHLLTFNGGTGTSVPMTIPALIPGEFVAVVVEWDQPYVTGAPGSGGSTSAIDLCINKVSGASDTIINDNGNTKTACSGASSVGSDPVQLLLIGNPASNANNSLAETVNIQVGLASGTTPGRIKVIIEGNGANLTFAPTGPTMQGHPYASGAAAVGAAYFYYTPACGDTTVELDNYSSQGGDPLLFSSTGTRLSSPQTRSKPDFVGPDGGNDTFLGFKDSTANNATPTQCKNNTAYPNFFGTSAATPHLAAVAALMLQADPALTPAQIRQFMRQSTIPVNPNDSSFIGAGFVQASTAATFVPAIMPAAPTLSLSANTVGVGGSVTLTWTSVNTTGCTASGSWSGSQSSNGSLVISPTAAGTNTYSLFCTNGAGNSTTASVMLTVTAQTVPAAPTLSLSATTVAVGGSVTITWSSANATGCTASGSWTGALGTSGSQTLSPGTAGTNTYTLLCTNAAGDSPMSSVTLTVTAAASGGSGGGGGSLDLWSLVALSLLTAGAIRTRRVSRQRA
jgi:hypothetical protein